MKRWIFIVAIFALCQSIAADQSLYNADRGRGSIAVNSSQIERVVTLFREISKLATPTGDPTAGTTCGYIFTGDPNKFGCKGTGRAASDVAAACAGGGQLACTGSGASRSCTCAFD